MKILVTGSAGFIGFHLVNHLLEADNEVVGLDNINDYYNVNLKYLRLQQAGIDKEKIKTGEMIRSRKYPGYRFLKSYLEDQDMIKRLFQEEKFDLIVHLAAQPGVRYSLENPHQYINSNILGFLNILEGCRHFGPKNLIYASSSSVYGNNSTTPFAEEHKTDQPISLYGATKKSNELMAYVYSNLFGLNTVGLRFFTVYGPYGRPDMAIFKFTKAILEEREIEVYNNGQMIRDFTYIDDVIDGIFEIISSNQIANGNYNIYNIGNSKPVNLVDFIKAIEKSVGKLSKGKMMPLQPGDALQTHSDVSKLERDYNYRPNTPINIGVDKFVKWYKYNYMGKLINH